MIVGYLRVMIISANLKEIGILPNACFLIECLKNRNEGKSGLMAPSPSKNEEIK